MLPSSIGLAMQASPVASHDVRLIITMIREWIIFALCLGVGGHIGLGVVMHAPGLGHGALQASMVC